MTPGERDPQTIAGEVGTILLHHQTASRRLWVGATTPRPPRRPGPDPALHGGRGATGDDDADERARKAERKEKKAAKKAAKKQRKREKKERKRSKKEEKRAAKKKRSRERSDASDASDDDRRDANTAVPRRRQTQAIQGRTPDEIRGDCRKGKSGARSGSRR
jgi:outer membrane biosynthesis protein TonB